MTEETKETEYKMHDLVLTRKMIGLKRRRGGVRYRRRKEAAKRALFAYGMSYVQKFRKFSRKCLVVMICADWNGGGTESGRSLIAMSSDAKNGIVVCGTSSVEHLDEGDYKERVEMFIDELRKQSNLRTARFVLHPSAL
jgi:hypothetical protein